MMKNTSPTRQLFNCLGAHLVHTSFGIAIVLLMGCTTPAPNSQTYVPRMSPDEMAASEARIDLVENTARRNRAEDAMSQAQAREVATRNNPTSVSTTTIIPFFW